MPDDRQCVVVVVVPDNLFTVSVDVLLMCLPHLRDIVLDFCQNRKVKSTSVVRNNVVRLPENVHDVSDIRPVHYPTRRCDSALSPEFLFRVVIVADCTEAEELRIGFYIEECYIHLSP